MFLCIVNDGKGKHKKYNKQSLFIRNITNYSVEIQLHKRNKIRVRKKFVLSTTSYKYVRILS